MIPTRIQLSRRKGFRLPRNTVVVARPSMWGNPFRVMTYTKAEVAAGLMMADAVQGICTTPDAAVTKFRRYLKTTEGKFLCSAARKVLAGKNLACWCPLGSACHADVLLDIANS